MEVTLSTLAYGGDAIGRLTDGRAVFVPYALAGERVRIEVQTEKGHYARAKLVEVLSPSPDRVAPRCKHFGRCGGCHYQHASYAAQLKAKKEILVDQLRRVGGVKDPPVGDVVASPTPWNYRNHLQFHLDPDGRLGFVRAGARREATDVLAIEECHLPEEPINTLWPQLDFEAGTGIARASIRAGSDEELMLVLESESPDAPEVEIEASVSVAHVFEGDVVLQAGRGYTISTVRGRDFRISPTSFFQVNAAVAELMIAHVLAQMPTAADVLMDVYCGVGLFGAFLAPRCRRLIGIEASAAACEDFAWNLDEFDNVDLYEDAAERVLPALKLRPDAVLLDPPRSGLEGAALDALVSMTSPVLIYVSCDPATLARDVSRLSKAGYRLESVQPFDMFPQTYHIESISVLTM